MPREGCKKGCKPGFGAKARWHDNAAQCDFEPSYDPNTRGACNCRGLAKKTILPPEGGKAAGVPGVPAVGAGETGTTAPAAPKPSGGSRLTASPIPAEVVPVKKIIKPPEQTEWYPDAPHVIGACNFAFSVAYVGQTAFDDWAGWKAHMPRSQFKLTPLAEDTIRMDSKNFYTRIVTTLCRWVGCKTQAQAHAAIDTVLFFGTAGGFLVALAKHNWQVVRHAPKFEAMREKKKVAEEAKRLAKQNAITVTGRDVTPVAAVA